MERASTMDQRATTIRFFACVLAVAALAGCDGSGHARYATEPADARAALEASLKAWSTGRAIDDVQADPPVRVVDSVWRGGGKIQSFEILGEAADSDGAKRFTARLTSVAGKTEKIEEVEYVVHGRDPIWVYRGEDYVRVLDMGDNPSPAKGKARNRGRSG
jgi:hypothetical protein